MSDVDKNQAVINFLNTCPVIIRNPLYFNFTNAKDSINQIVTLSNDRYASRRFVDGSVLKIYSFTIITYKSTAPNPIVKMPDKTDENVSDMSEVQGLIDWIREQEDLHNYPDFGEDCVVDEISTTTDNPSFDGIDDEISPPLAVYSVTIEIRYLDRSKQWR